MKGQEYGTSVGEAVVGQVSDKAGVEEQWEEAGSGWTMKRLQSETNDTTVNKVKRKTVRELSVGDDIKINQA